MKKVLQNWATNDEIVAEQGMRKALSNARLHTLHTCQILVGSNS